MSFKINSINIQFENGKMDYVIVYFNRRVNNDRSYISGHVELTVEEYLQNSTSEKLTNLVKQKAIDFINEDFPEEVPEEEVEIGVE